MIAPHTRILLETGPVRADEVKTGDLVRTRPEWGEEYLAYPVSEVGRGDADITRVFLRGGRTLDVAQTHRFMVRGIGWVEAQYLGTGDFLIGTDPGVVQYVLSQPGQPIVQIRVASAETYITEGVLSHECP